MMQEYYNWYRLGCFLGVLFSSGTALFCIWLISKFVSAWDKVPL